KAALAHLGERQTEVHFRSLKIWRHCVRSTEAAYLSANRGSTLIITNTFFFSPYRASFCLFNLWVLPTLLTVYEI
ncbi:hypothetical protein BKA61DRAFT_477855, partial [Leptodontidium sp. MPI-SDFR-AT-0119]